MDIISHWPPQAGRLDRTLTFGQDTWQKVRDKAQLEEEVFSSLDPYPDEITYNLVAAASEILGAPAEDLLEAFGEYWILYTAQEGYGDMMQMFGISFPEFLANLDNMHGHIAVTMPDLRPPSFQCDDHGDGRYTLHYRSERAGFSPMILGLLRGLGQRFGVGVQVTQIGHKSKGGDHDQVSIQLET